MPAVRIRRRRCRRGGGGTTRTSRRGCRSGSDRPPTDVIVAVVDETSLPTQAPQPPAVGSRQGGAPTSADRHGARRAAERGAKGRDCGQRDKGPGRAPRSRRPPFGPRESVCALCPPAPGRRASQVYAQGGNTVNR
eukprot:5273205-Pyramimonas_sp.AAC.1